MAGMNSLDMLDVVWCGLGPVKQTLTVTLQGESAIRTSSNERLIGARTGCHGDRGGDFLLRVGDEHFPKNNFGRLLEPKYLICLKLGYFSGIFCTERLHIWTCLLLYDSKDEMKSMLKWTIGPKSRSTRREYSRNSKICARSAEHFGNFGNPQPYKPDFRVSFGAPSIYYINRISFTYCLYLCWINLNLNCWPATLHKLYRTKGMV